MCLIPFILYLWEFYVNDVFSEHVQIRRNLSRDFVKTGYLHKTPPNKPVSFRITLHMVVEPHCTPFITTWSTIAPHSTCIYHHIVLQHVMYQCHTAADAAHHSISHHHKQPVKILSTVLHHIISCLFTVVSNQGLLCAHLPCLCRPVPVPQTHANHSFVPRTCMYIYVYVCTDKFLGSELASWSFMGRALHASLFRCKLA